MMNRAFQFILCCLSVIFVVGLIRDQMRLSELTSEAERLQSLVGRLDVSDSNRVHVSVVQIDLPERIVWRVYLPPRQRWKMTSRSVGGGSGMSSFGTSKQPFNEIVRWQVVRDDGSWRREFMHGHGSSQGTETDRQHAFLRDHWDQLDVQYAGRDGQQSVDTDQVISLLSVAVPEGLLPIAKSELGEYRWKRLKEEPLLDIQLGTIEAFAAEEAGDARGVVR